MKTSFFAVVALALAGAVTGSAEIVYNNTATDTFLSYMYTGNGADQIGDTITLGGSQRTLSSASVQFWNQAGSGGTFDALLSFWTLGSPVGSQIGSTYTVTGLNIGSMSVLTVDFANLNLAVPSTFVFAVAIANAGGLDLGLNAFEPPSVGSSNGASIILRTGGLFSEAATDPGKGNLYLQLQAVPEPSTWAMSVGAVAFLLAASRRKR